jgi:hypothetical protein
LEKTVTKSICRVLNGFKCEDIPDSGEEYMKRGIAIIPKEGEEEKFSGEEIGLEFAKVLKNAVDD